jgi:rhodanese-related sulfurtransferase
MSFLSVLRNLLPKSFTAESLEALRAANSKAVLIDVREPQEFAEGHIQGSVLVPMGKIPHHAKAIADSGHPVVVICRSGARASSCAGVLRQQGAREVHVLSGGVLAWQRAGKPVKTGSKSPGLFTLLKP